MIAKAIARAWRDPEYKAKLLGDPHAALAEAGIEIPEGTQVKVVENTADIRHIVLPVAPEGELSDEEIERLAGGAEIDKKPVNQPTLPTIAWR